MSAKPMNVQAMRFFPRWIDRLADANRELWLLLSMFVIAALLNRLVASHGMVLGFYTLPTLFSAYVYGRRHAVLTAIASVFLVVGVSCLNPNLLTHSSVALGNEDRWFDLTIWGGLLTVTAYAMGSLYERKESYLRELRRTYFSVLTILQQFISNDKYTHNHSYRVAIYASTIATRLGFDEQRIDDLRAAALLHDIGKLKTNRDLLFRAANLTPEELAEEQNHVPKQTIGFDPAGSSLRRILPTILAHDEVYSDAGHQPKRLEDVPIEARVLGVADAYDTLTSDRPYRRAVTPFEAKDIIVAGSGADFDPKVVDAFVAAFTAGQMELPENLVI